MDKKMTYAERIKDELLPLNKINDDEASSIYRWLNDNHPFVLDFKSERFMSAAHLILALQAIRNHSR